MLYVIYESKWDNEQDATYRWTASSAGQAISICEQLEQEYPDRKWKIEEIKHDNK